MKKILFTLIATMSSMVLLTGCQNSKSELEKFVEGEWKLTSIESRGTVVEGEDLDLSYKGEVIYTFNEDGTGSILIAEQLVEGNWEINGSTVVLTCNDLDAEFVQEDEYLVATPSGVRVELRRHTEGADKVQDEAKESEEVEETEATEEVEETEETEE